MARCSLLLVTAAAALRPLPLHTPLRTCAAPRVICLRESPWMSPITVEAPGLNGGDLWAGARGSDEEFEYAISEAMSMTITAPIIPQFYPQRRWLWRKWRGTILPRVLPREVAFNVGFAIACVLLARLPATVAEAPAAAQILRTISGNLRTVDKVWLLTSGLVSFTLSFFLTQSYAFWRSVYSSTRKVQGRLNDIGLLCAGAAERDSRGEYTEGAEQLLSVLGRYVRLYSMLLYSSCTTRFAVLQTPRGLGALVDCGALTTAERTAMLQTGMGSNAVLMWMSTLLNSGLSDGRLGGSPTGGQPLGLQLAFQQCFTELRGCSASIADELTGRMPLAYTQLVQIMADLLIAATPFALLHSVGGVGAVVGTALVTFFHSSILYLAKMFLDPLNNDQYSSDMGINVATLMQETNLGSERWRKSAQWVPEATLPRDRSRTNEEEERWRMGGGRLASSRTNEGGNQVQSGAIRCNQVQAEGGGRLASRTDAAPNEGGNQVQSGAIRTDAATAPNLAGAANAEPTPTPTPPTSASAPAPAAADSLSGIRLLGKGNVPLELLGLSALAADCSADCSAAPAPMEPPMEPRGGVA